MKIKNYFLYVKWEDIQKKKHIVGVLAYVDGEYYLKGKRIGDINKELTGNTFNGIPPHRDAQLYKSNELFEFFANRVPLEARDNPYTIFKELISKKGKSHIDSFTVEQIENERDRKKWEKLIRQLTKLLKERQVLEGKQESNYSK